MDHPSEIPRLAGLRVLDGYDDVKQALRSRSLAPAQHDTESEPIIGGTLITLSDSEHTSRRQLHARLFTVSALEEYERAILVPVIESTLSRLSSNAATDGSWSCDLVALNTSLLIELAGRLIGVDDISSFQTSDRLAELYSQLVEGASVEWSARDHSEVLEAALSAKACFWEEFVEPAVASRRGNKTESPRLDLVSVCLDDPDHAWSDEDILRECILYLVAAITTTASLITHVVDELDGWFTAHPEERILAADPEFLRSAAAETVRLHTPTSALLRRATETSTLAGGATFVPDEVIALNLDGANRDATKVGIDAATFDPHRKAPPGVAAYGHAFGGGPHICVGRTLALPTRALAGDDRRGIAVSILERLYSAGIEPDPNSEPEMTDTYLDIFSKYPVRFGVRDMTIHAP